MFDPQMYYKLYRQELDRVERELELRRQLPERERRHLPHVRFTLARQQRRARVAEPSGC